MDGIWNRRIFVEIVFLTKDRQTFSVEIHHVSLDRTIEVYNFATSI